VVDKYIGTYVNKYPTLKYKYKYKYLKFVLEYWSSTSTSTKYYITAGKICTVPCWPVDDQTDTTTGKIASEKTLVFSFKNLKTSKVQISGLYFLV